MNIKFALLSGIIFAASCISAGASHREQVFGPKPYIDFFNVNVGEFYRNIEQAGVELSSDNKIFLKKGIHKLTLKGREPGTRVKEFRIIPADSKNGTKAAAVIDICKGTFESPMEPVREDGDHLIVSGDAKGSAEYNFTIDHDGEYVIQGKAWGPDSASNSFYVSLDGGRNFIWDVPLSPKVPGQWTDVARRNVKYFSSWNLPMAWGATSPQSIYRDNADFRRIALALSEASTASIAERKVKPAQLWFLADLEAINLWREDSRTDKQTITRLLNAMRPYINACCEMVLKHDGWCDNTPNIQMQSAVILQLASQMWKNCDPEASEKWARTANDCIERAIKWKLQDGPFSYSYGSGVDAGYFSLDAKHLSRYYMLTGDKRVEQALKDMTLFAANTSSYGHPLSLGSPWWKHCYSDYDRTATAAKVTLLPLLLSRDPLYAKVVEMDLQRGLSKPYPPNCDWLISYYNSLQPEFRSKIADFEDKTFFSKIDNGPTMRSGALNISMPWHSWCESDCGAFYSTPDSVVSQICSTILTAVTADTKGKKVEAYYPIAYSIVEQLKPVPELRATIIAKTFIASATMFRPALGGPATPNFTSKDNDSPWQRCDIYFADANGYAGLLELQALRDNDCTRVALWTRCSVNDLTIKDNQINVPGLSLELEKKYSGQIFNRGKIWGPPQGFYPLDLLESVVKETGSKGFKKGELFQTTVSVRHGANARLTIGRHSSADGLDTVEILLAGKPYALLLFNRSSKTVQYKPEDKWLSSVQSDSASGQYRQLKNNADIDLRAGSLTIYRR